MKPISKILPKVLLMSWFLFAGCKKDELRTSTPTDVPTTSITPCAGRSIVNATLVPVGALSLERSSIKSATAGNKILFIGGSNSNSNSHPSLVVDIYDYVSNTWTTKNLEENSRDGIAVTSAGDKVFMAGGGDFVANIYTSRIDIYDATNETWSFAGLSGPRADIAAASAGDKVVFAGGYNNDDMFDPSASTTVDIYDIPTNYRRTTELKTGRSHISATTIGNKIYFAGGQSELRLFDNVDIYDVTTNTWET